MCFYIYMSKTRKILNYYKFVWISMSSPSLKNDYYKIFLIFQGVLLPCEPFMHNIFNLNIPTHFIFPENKSQLLKLWKRSWIWSIWFGCFGDFSATTIRIPLKTWDQLLNILKSPEYQIKVYPWLLQLFLITGYGFLKIISNKTAITKNFSAEHNKKKSYSLQDFIHFHVFTRPENDSYKMSWYFQVFYDHRN